ncbi:uncharacterized protein LOC118181538 [Stegodyphus dumicola]|uniref:uncharacterized protein LOC118181538 n=1 Tax=Stegodyphus dumicola TaxID=202533 RepID=UPI0015A81086|nr:uncharacterized protein LOC118181538 [Stegodyphus dumicola]
MHDINSECHSEDVKNLELSKSSFSQKISESIKSITNVHDRSINKHKSQNKMCEELKSDIKTIQYFISTYYTPVKPSEKKANTLLKDPSENCENTPMESHNSIQETEQNSEETDRFHIERIQNLMAFLFNKVDKDFSVIENLTKSMKKLQKEERQHLSELERRWENENKLLLWSTKYMDNSSQAQNEQETSSSGMEINKFPGIKVTNKPLSSNLGIQGLTENAKKAISKASGPLTVEQLAKFLSKAKYKNKPLTLMRKFTSDTSSLLQQLTRMKNILEQSSNDYRKQYSQVIKCDKRLLHQLDRLILKLEKQHKI